MHAHGRQVKDSFQSSCERVVRELPWVRDVAVRMTHRKAPSRTARVTGLKDVSHLVAVASCKGE
jgi:SH3-like domain-containing protein